jgi:FKBP-type peptidyl-prolyl cis-trans isomerase
LFVVVVVVVIVVVVVVLVACRFNSDVQELDDGDIAGVFYEGFGVDKNKVGTQFGSSSSLLKVTLGSGTCIRGLEQGVVGMKKGGQRIIVVPPALVDKRLEPNPPSGIPLVFFVCC